MGSLSSLLVLTCLLQGAAPSATLSGIVVSLDGQPIAGARVDISTAGPRVGRGFLCPSCYRDCKKSARTDDRGHFELTGLDPTLRFHLLVCMPGKQTLVTDWVEPTNGAVRLVLADAPSDMPPERTVRRQLVDDLGIPLDGAVVSPCGAKKLDMKWAGRVEGVDTVVADNQGRIAILLPKELESIDVEITAPGYAGALAQQLSPGGAEERLVVPPGARGTGRLVFAGLPIVGARVAIAQLNRTAGHHFVGSIEDVTDADGRFVFDHLPANEAYVIFSVLESGPQRHVLSTKRFMAPADRKERDLGALETIIPLRLKGRVELPTGQALPPDAQMFLDRDPAWDWIMVPVDADGSFDFGGIPPETYRVRLVVPGFRLNDREIPYQLAGDQAFSLRVDDSIDDLRVPVQPIK